MPRRPGSDDPGADDAGGQRPHRRVGGRTGGDEGTLDAGRGGKRQRPRPRPKGCRRHPPIRGAEIRHRRGRSGGKPQARHRQPARPPGGTTSPAIVAKVREGLEGVERSFVGTLERNGIKREDPVGQPFDPNLHQAMAEQESELTPPGTVMQAWSKAWTLNGRLLRPGHGRRRQGARPRELAGSGEGVSRHGSQRDRSRGLL